jgi:Domain of unknown function (DUF6431)
MVIVMEFGPDVQSYGAHYEARSFPRPAVCPHCQVSGTLIGHGFYERQPTDGQHDYRIQIKRWYCTACHVTTSLLPSFLLRFRHYLLSVIQSVVVARFEQHASWTPPAPLLRRPPEPDHPDQRWHTDLMMWHCNGR